MKVKRIIASTLLLCFCVSVYAQNREDSTPRGKVNGKVFFNYHYDVSKGSEKESQFEIKRSYLGYDYRISDDFRASITLDVGKNEGGSDYSAFLKKAQLDWRVHENINITFGMIGNIQFKEQERFWGYRYLLKSYADQYAFGSSADVGVKARFRLNDQFTANVMITNGEGYKKVQDTDGNQRMGASIVYQHKKLTAKLYADLNSGKVTNEKGVEEDVNSTIFVAFLAYRFSEKFRFGAEYNRMNNATKYSAVADGNNLSGFSFYSTYTLNDKWGFFGRYDTMNSNRLKGETADWNEEGDGSAITAGVEYQPTRGVKMALNYQGFDYKKSSLDDRSKIYFNIEFKF